MTFPIVQIVASPDQDADVLFDFHEVDTWPDYQVWTAPEQFSLGGPTPTGAPGSYGSDDDVREIAFTCYIEATPADASRLYSSMGRLLRRRTGWLHVQLSSFSPSLYFRIYKATPGPLRFENVVTPENEGQLQVIPVDLTIPADPYAQGERITLGPYTINNDVAAGTNPCSVVLPEIVGDAPAPVRLDMTGTFQDIPSPMVGITPVPDNYAPVTVQFGTGDTVIPSTDMDAAASSASYSGGSYRPISFATEPGMVNRCTVPLPNVRPGRYAVWLRVARPFTSGTFALQAVMDSRSPGDVVSVDRPAAPVGGYRQWVDLGTFLIPAGFADYDTTDVIGTSVDIRAAQTSGSSGLWFDVLTLVPVELFEDEPGLRMTFLPDMLDSAPGVLRVDGDAGYFQHYSAAPSVGGVVMATNPTELYGGKWPMVSPGRANLLTLFRQTSGAARVDGQLGDQRGTLNNADVLSMTTAVTVSYMPRWLWLAAQ